VIAAPPGSGKTSLIRAWADNSRGRRQIAGVQVQRGWRDAQLFWLTLLNTVRDLAPESKGTEALTATLEFDAEDMVDRVLAELSDNDDGVTLVIDDVHELVSPNAFDHLSRLLTNLPDGTNAVLATRHDLPLRLHQLRLAGELTELRASDMRFTEPEADAMLEQAGVVLSPQASALLYQRTEGWAAGLRLATLALVGHSDPDRFVADFGGNRRDVADYLMAEMLDRQSAEVRDMLLRTSILQHVNGDLADALTGRVGSERHFLDLEDANMFVVSLDSQRSWFRYHHLFADLLRLELRRTLPAELPALHRRAAQWLSENGHIVEAVRHRQGAGDWPAAAELLIDHAFGMMLDGQEETMQSLLAAFPRHVESEFGELNMVRAMANLAHGQLGAAASDLSAAEASVENAPPQRAARLRDTLASLKMGLARRRGDRAEVLRHARLLTVPGPPAGPDEGVARGSDLRVMALLNVGTVEWCSLGPTETWSQDRRAGESHLRDGADLARRIRRPYLELACLAQLAAAATRLPSFSETRQRCDTAIALADVHGWGDAAILAPALVTLAYSMLWTGDLDQADRWLPRVDQALAADSGPSVGLGLHLIKGMAHSAHGRWPEAGEAFEHARRMQAQLAEPHALSGLVYGWSAVAWIRTGAAERSRALLDGILPALATAGEILNAHAQLEMAEGRPDHALTSLAPVVDGTSPCAHPAALIETHLVRALCHHRRGESRHAFEALERALELAEPEHVILPFLMTDTSELLEAMPPNRTKNHLLRTAILEALGGTVGTPAMPGPAGEELSPSELRIMQFLPTNLSRPEIAEQLHVSVNTVNTHIRNIYRKLDATDRTSAVRRARELGMLATRSS
jgi:LuxR family maltose regulon positive regulatory protein